MNSIKQFQFLKFESVIPRDSKIISTHNNLVVSSDSENTVSRISTMDKMNSRKDPGNILYSHYISRNIGVDGNVLAPIDSEPIEFEGNIISRYPKMPTPNWDYISGGKLAEAVYALNNFSYSPISCPMPIRQLDIAQYAQCRLDSVSELKTSTSTRFIQCLLDYYCTNYSLHSATLKSRGLVHGDLHAGNVVLDDAGDELLFIDLDSIAIGPKEYDLASWCVRSMRGDRAPAKAATDIAIEEGITDKNLIRSMVGWKVISSMTHELVYNLANSSEQIAELASIAEQLDAPGFWSKYVK